MQYYTVQYGALSSIQHCIRQFRQYSTMEFNSAQFNGRAAAYDVTSWNEQSFLSLMHSR